MKIAFLALTGTVAFSQIGGTDSFMRRLIYGLLKRVPSLDISCVFYSSEACAQARPTARLSFLYFTSFEEALAHLAGSGYCHVIASYLLPKHRIAFAKFRVKNKETTFHKILFFYPESRVHRLGKFSEFLLAPYNGTIFCVSQRQYDYIRRLTAKAVYLLPPVPEEYFLTPSEKNSDNALHVTFLGRIDPRKGIVEVVDIFRKLRESPGLVCTIYGIHISQDKEAQEWRDRLRSQEEIPYIEMERQSYSSQVEERVKNVLKNTDVIVLPYRTLDSTVDTPLLVLEAMASLCAVITTPVGDLPRIYGQTEFLIDRKGFVDTAHTLLTTISADRIQQERERIYARNLTLRYRSSEVVETFYHALG